MLPDDLVEAEARGAAADHMLAQRTYTAVLHAGMGYAAYQSFMVGLGAKPISDKAFFGAQTQVEPVVEQMSKDIMKDNRKDVREAFEQHQQRTDVAADCSWSRKVKAYHGAVTMMTFPDQRVLAMEIRSKKHARKLADGRQIIVNPGNHLGSSNVMEAEGTRLALKLLSEEKVLSAIGTWVTDGDTTTRDEVQQYADAAHCKFALDLGHVVKNIKKGLVKACGTGKGFKSFPKRAGATFMRIFKRVAKSEPAEQRPDLLRLLLNQVVPHYTNTKPECDRGCFCHEKQRKAAGAFVLHLDCMVYHD
jgi:hypothetical protein